MKTVIIGGVAGGATLATRLRRRDENAQIIIFERSGYVSYANCGLPYYIGGTIERRDALLLHTVESLSRRFKLDIRIHSEVTAIDAASQTVTVRNFATGEEYRESYDRLAIATGAAPIRPFLPGIDSKRIFTLRSVEDTDLIKSFIDKQHPTTAVIIGGGFIGLELAESMHHAGISVTIVEKAPQVMAPIDLDMAAHVHRRLREHGVKLMLGEGVASFEDVGTALRVHTDLHNAVEADMAVLAIGVRPDVRLAREAGLQIGTAGGIVTNEFMQTSDPRIYALGDAAETFNPVTGKAGLIPLAGPANKQARIVADNIVDGNKHRYSGTIGTSVAKVFDLTVAAAGASSKLLQREGIEHIASITSGASHAGYYPGAEQMWIRINFAPDSGRLLGAQIVGGTGTDKRIDLMAQVIRTGGSVYDLQVIEHAYAPPYSSAKDPVNIAGFVAENILAGRMKTIHAHQLASLDPATTTLLDVRTAAEYEAGHLDGALNIPLDELRNRLSELPTDKAIVVYCAVGLRGYIASQILVQSSYTNVANLAGGYGHFLVWSLEFGVDS